MSRFTTDRDRFMGGILRKAGSEFVLKKEDVPKKLPEGMKEIGALTPAQKSAQTKADKAEAKARKEAEAEKKAAGADKSPDFMEGEVVSK